MVRESNLFQLSFLKDLVIKQVLNCFLDWGVNQNKQKNVLLADADGT